MEEVLDGCSFSVVVGDVHQVGVAEFGEFTVIVNDLFLKLLFFIGGGEFEGVEVLVVFEEGFEDYLLVVFDDAVVDFDEGG